MIQLRYWIGKVEDFDALCIDTSTQRKSIDGVWTFVHDQELATIDMNGILDAVENGFEDDEDIRTASFFQKADEDMQELLNGPLWSVI